MSSTVYILIAIIGFYRADSGGTTMQVEFFTEKACLSAMAEIQQKPMPDSKFAVIQQIGCYKKAL